MVSGGPRRIWVMVPGEVDRRQEGCRYRGLRDQDVQSSISPMQHRSLRLIIERNPDAAEAPWHGAVESDAAAIAVVGVE